MKSAKTFVLAIQFELDPSEVWFSLSCPAPDSGVSTLRLDYLNVYFIVM